MFAKIINILIFAVILYFYLRKPLKYFLRDRRKSLSDLIKTAHDTYNVVAAEEEKIKRKLSTVREEIEILTAELKKEADLERVKITGDSAKYAEEIIKESRAYAKNEILKATLSIKVDVANQIMTLAKKRLTSEITPDQHDRLINSAIKEIAPTL